MLDFGPQAAVKVHREQFIAVRFEGRTPLRDPPFSGDERPERSRQRPAPRIAGHFAGLPGRCRLQRRR